jgi:two-component system, OmpR family, sensor kinase
MITSIFTFATPSFAREARQCIIVSQSGQSPVSVPPEDDFAIALRNVAGESLPTAANGTSLPRQPGSGFSTVRFGGEFWRVYTASDDRRTAQIAQRMSVRQEIAEHAAIEAAAPILVVIPLAWLVIGWARGECLGSLQNSRK